MKYDDSEESRWESDEGCERCENRERRDDRGDCYFFDGEHDWEHDWEPREERRPSPIPGDSGFLDFEISKVIYQEAEELARDAFRDLVKESVETILKERFGERIQSLATLAVNEFDKDLEANLTIERLMAERKASRETLDERVQDIFGQSGESAPEEGEEE